MENILTKLKGQKDLDWFKFGKALGVPNEITEQLVGYSEKDALVEVVDYWLKHHHFQPTWKEITDALKKAEVI